MTKVSRAKKMSEYTFVEKPLLNQLASMDWQVIDQGEGVLENLF